MILTRFNILFFPYRKQHQEEYARNQVHTIYFLSLDFYVKSDFYFVKLKIYIFFSFQAELNRLQESVHRLRNDYERCIDSYIVAKAKYEDQYTKVSSTYLKFNVKFVFKRLWFYQKFQNSNIYEWKSTSSSLTKSKSNIRLRPISWGESLVGAKK